jgi:hypothetical protein
MRYVGVLSHYGFLTIEELRGIIDTLEKVLRYGTNEPLTETQYKILDALRGRALSRKELARYVDCEETSMSKDHLKELIDLRLVKHDRRTGYFRPDSPPSPTE